MPFASEVVQTGRNNQLADVLSRQVVRRSLQSASLEQPSLDRIDRHIRQRIAAYERDYAGYDNRSGQLAAGFAVAWENAERLQASRHQMDFSSGSTLSEQLPVGVDSIVQRALPLHHGVAQWWWLGLGHAS